MPSNSPNFVAQGNIRPSRFVKIDTANDNGVLEADAGERTIGISTEAGNEPPLPSVSTIYAGIDNQPMAVYGLGETCLLELGDTVTRGDRLKSDADGCGVTASSSGNLFGAIALSSGAVGEKIRVQVQQGAVP
jgi:hypothetical protein